jgi:hypothetical protein
MTPIPSPDGAYHVCEYAGTIRCFFQPGQVKRDPLDGEKRRNVALATRYAPPQAVAHDPGAVASSPASGPTQPVLLR